MLSSFTGLRELGLVVERHPAFPQAASAGNGAAATATAPGAGRDPSPGGSGAAAQQEEGTGAGAGPSRPALGRWRVAELPPTLDVNCLPAGLTALELCNLVLDMGPGPRQGRCGAPGTADAGGKGQGAEQQQRQQGPGLDMGLGVGDGERGAPGGASSAGAANLPVPLCAIRGQGGPPVPQAEPAVHQAAAEAEAATPTSPLPSLPSPPPPLPLSQLTRLDVEGCVVRPQLLAALAERVGPSLQSLRLVGVVGLADAALGAALRRLAVLRSLAVSAPGNRAGGHIQMRSSCTFSTNLQCMVTYSWCRCLDFILRTVTGAGHFASSSVLATCRYTSAWPHGSLAALSGPGHAYHTRNNLSH